MRKSVHMVHIQWKQYVFAVYTVGSRQRVQGRKKPKKTPRSYIKLGSTAETHDGGQ